MGLLDVHGPKLRASVHPTPHAPAAMNRPVTRCKRALWHPPMTDCTPTLYTPSGHGYYVPMHARARGSCKNADPGAGLGVMLVEEGGADGEAGGGSPSSSAKLQLVGALRRGKCSGAAAATGWAGRIDGARGRLWAHRAAAV